MKRELILVVLVGVISAGYPVLIYNTNLSRNDMFLSQDELIARLVSQVEVCLNIV
jgi:hypothetical protein